MRCENMVTKKHMFDDVLDYCDQIRDFVKGAQSKDNQEYKDIFELYSPNNESTHNQIKLMYPITHSIGFFQTLEYLHTLNKLDKNMQSMSQDSSKDSKLMFVLQGFCALSISNQQ